MTVATCTPYCESDIMHCHIGIYPLLRNYDVWGETVGTNWNLMACERRDRIFLSSSFPGMSAVFHCLSLSKVGRVVSLCYCVVSKFDGH